MLGGLNSIVGHNIAKSLAHYGLSVSVTGRTAMNKYNLNAKEINFFIGDLNDEAFKNKILKDQEIIINCIAAYKLGLNQKHLRESNFGVIKNLLKSLRSTKVFINLSTINVYGRTANGILARDTPRKPEDDYGKYKNELEKYISENYWSFSSISLHLPAVLSIPSNEHLIQRFVNKLIKNEPLQLFTPNQLFNNVVSVDDLVNFIIQLINNDRHIIDSFPIASSEPITLISIVEQIKKALDSRSRINIVKKGNTSIIIDDLYARHQYFYNSRSTQSNIEEFLQTYAK